MASNCSHSTIHANSSPHPTSIHIPIPTTMIPSPLSPIDYSARSQWLCDAVLAAKDGLITVSSLMIGIGVVNESPRTMLISGFAGLVSGAFSMAIGEFISVKTQYDFESAQLKRDCNDGKERLPSTWKVGAVSALAFATGVVLPLLACGFIKSWVTRGVVVAVTTSIGLTMFGAAGAAIGGTAVGKGAMRFSMGGSIAMMGTFGILGLFRLAFNMNDSNVA